MIKIVYSYPSASGNEVRHTIEATTFDEAKEICQRIEARPDYRIEDLWQDPDLGDLREAIEMAIEALQREAEDGRAERKRTMKHYKSMEEPESIKSLSETKYADLAKSIIDEGNYESAVELMDNDIREELHNRYAPCDEVTFLALYMDAHRQIYGEDFAL